MNTKIYSTKEIFYYFITEQTEGKQNEKRPNFITISISKYVLFIRHILRKSPQATRYKAVNFPQVTSTTI